ncbi:MAG: ROK family transcriptional regulator [Clostridia bacterium]|nr:ROK family transcriptional regulator [Clostridia bacterium]
MEQLQRGQSPSSVRFYNFKTIFMAVYGADRITKREIQDITSLSWGTVTTMVDRLEEAGYIVKNGKAFTNGRSAAYYSVNRDRGSVIGIDLNLSGATAVSTDCYGQVRKSVSVPLSKDGAEAVIAQIIGMTDEIIKQTPGMIYGIGVAVQGTLDTQHGVSSSILQIPDWKDVRLAEIFEKKFGCKTYLLHDPDCINLAEQKIGANISDYNRGTIALIRIDSGVGLSTLINNHLSTNGYASELGHICVEPHGPRCLCGNIGCLEEYASTGGISRRYTAIGGEPNTPAGEIAERAKEGDRRADSVIRGFCEKLGMAVSSIVNMLPIDTVIFYGELSRVLSENDAEFRQQFNSHVFMHRQVNVRYSALSGDAAAIGASLWATKNLLRELSFSEMEE